MTSDENEERPSVSAIEKIASDIKHICKKTDSIENRMDDAYHALREILEAVSKENGEGWYDLYEEENGYT